MRYRSEYGNLTIYLYAQTMGQQRMLYDRDTGNINDDQDISKKKTKKTKKKGKNYKK